MYPGGQLDEFKPGAPIGPNRATNAYAAIVFGELTNVALLALVANELVDGIPNGKNMLII